MMPAQLNNRYKIINELGRGSFCVTYLAEDIDNYNSRCVVKKLDPFFADRQTAKRLFIREANILQQLNDTKQIPDFIECFEENESLYLVEEYVDGKTLDRLFNKPLNHHYVINLIEEILLILKPLHQQNIIHRDIKPSNLIRRKKDNKLVLIDFGAVKQINTENGFTQPQKNQTRIYTGGYAPLEQREGKPNFNSDIYSVGMTAIQLLTGKHPKHLFRDEQENIIFPPEIKLKKSLVNILNKMVRIDANERYQSIEELSKELKIFTQKRNSWQGFWQDFDAIDTLEAIIKSIVQNGTTVTFGLGAIGTIAICVELFYPIVRPLYYSYQGDRLLETDRPEEALEQFQNTISLKSDSASAWKGLGTSLLAIAQKDEMQATYQQALIAFDRAQNFDDRDRYIWFNRGLVLEKLGNNREAITSYNQAIELGFLPAITHRDKLEEEASE
jgi:serine/threonine protein kinase